MSVCHGTAIQRVMPPGSCAQSGPLGMVTLSEVSTAPRLGGIQPGRAGVKRNGCMYIVQVRTGQVISQPGWKASARQNSSAARVSISPCSASGTSSIVRGGTRSGS